MVVEEYSNKKAEFWISFFKIMSVFPILVFAFYCVFFFIGTFRPEKINNYNKKAQLWVNGGLEEFKNNSFYIEYTGGNETFEAISHAPGVYYPVRDDCRLEGDPASGCVYTKAYYYSLPIKWMKHGNYIRVYHEDGSLLVSTIIDGYVNYTKNPKQLGCYYNKKYCAQRCDESGGLWNPSTLKCTIKAYADGLCFRVIKEGSIWKLDTNNYGKLPRNKNFDWFISDSNGCDYGDDWHSVHYGKQNVSEIRVSIRSYKDSYLAASAYTESCSNDYIDDHQCFGITQLEEKAFTIQMIQLFGIIVAAIILIYILFFIASKCKYRRAVRESNRADKSELLTA